MVGDWKNEATGWLIDWIFCDLVKSSLELSVFENSSEPNSEEFTIDEVTSDSESSENDECGGTHGCLSNLRSGA